MRKTFCIKKSDRQEFAADYGRLRHTPLPIELGGTFGRTPEEALSNLGVAAASALGTSGGFAKLNPDGHIDLTTVPDDLLYLPTVYGPKLVQFNTLNEYHITNFDTMTSYTVTCDVGAVTLVKDKVLYTAPGNVNVGGFFVNGNFTEVWIGDIKPSRPVIISPINGASELQFPMQVTSTVFSLGTKDLVDTHAASDWQISENGLFTKIVHSAYNDTTNKTNWTVPSLEIGKIYYIRVRHRGEITGWGDWSPVTYVVTKTLPPAVFSYQLQAPAPDYYTGAGYEINSNFGTTASLYGENSNFGGGQAVSLSGDGSLCLVGAAAGGSGDKGAAYVFKRNEKDWTKVAELVPKDREDLSRFGWSVQMAMDGSFCVVGAKYKNGDAAATPDVGAVYVFLNTGSNWVQQQKITPDSETTGLFGYSVGLSDNGEVLVIGALGADGITQNAGGVFIYERVNGSFEKKQLLYEQPSTTGLNYGATSPSLNASGTVLAIGHSQAAGGGEVHIYRKDSLGVWSVAHKIQPEVTQAGYDHFGHSVSLSADGLTLAVGCDYYDTYATDSGAAFIYQLEANAWVKKSNLVPSVVQTNARFGAKVQLTANGKVCVVGCPSATFNSYYVNSGLVFVFAKDAQGVWYQINKLSPNPKANNQFFGNDFSVAKDGSVCAIGFVSTNYDFVGKVDIYDNVTREVSALVGPSVQTAAFLSPFAAPAMGEDYSQHFGYFVAMSGDGNTCAVSCPMASVYGVTAYSGLVAIYVKDAGVWRREAVLKNAPPRSGVRLGSSVALNSDGTLCYVGAKDENRGVVYVWTKDGGSWAQLAVLTPAVDEVYDPYLFGTSLATTSDGGVCFVGAPGLGLKQFKGVSGSWSSCGGIYVYVKNGSVYTLATILTPEDTIGHQSKLGTSVAVTPTGDWIVAGAPGVDWNYQTNVMGDGGAAYVYKKVGETWLYSDKVMPTRSQSSGMSVAISDDGQRVALGCPDNVGATSVSGAVYVFEKNSVGLWDQVFDLLGYDDDKTQSVYKFGTAVALSSDGMVLAVGAAQSSASTTQKAYEGAVFVYVKDGNVWNLRNKHYNPTSESYSYFGNSVSLSKNASSLAVGAPYEDVLGTADAGAVYFYA